MPSRISLSNFTVTDTILQNKVQPKDFLQHKKEDTRSKPHQASMTSALNQYKLFPSKHHGYKINDSFHTSFSIDITKVTQNENSVQLSPTNMLCKLSLYNNIYYNYSN